MNRRQLRKIVLKRKGDMSAREMTRELGLSEGHAVHLIRFLANEQPPRPAILRALGFRRISTEFYEPVK